MMWKEPCIGCQTLDAFRLETVAMIKPILSCRAVDRLLDGTPRVGDIEEIVWIMSTPSVVPGDEVYILRLRVIADALGHPLTSSFADDLPNASGGADPQAQDRKPLA